MPTGRQPGPSKPVPRVADLVLALRDPAIDASEGKRRAAAIATLVYKPPDGAPEQSP